MVRIKELHLRFLDSEHKDMKRKKEKHAMNWEDFVYLKAMGKLR